MITTVRTFLISYFEISQMIKRKSSEISLEWLFVESVCIPLRMVDLPGGGRVDNSSRMTSAPYDWPSMCAPHEKRTKCGTDSARNVHVRVSVWEKKKVAAS